MRLHYYRFPDTVDTQTRFLNGASAIGGGECELDRESCEDCQVCAEGWS